MGPGPTHPLPNYFWIFGIFLTLQSPLLPILFADDTNVFLTGNNIDQMIEIMNGELNNVFLWLNSNKLSLNVKKTAIHGI